MITTFYPPFNFGGDGIFVHRLSNELARRGHHVEVVHCVDSYRMLAATDGAREYDDHPNVSVHGLRSRFGVLSPLATHQSGRPALKSRRLREILQGDFDVIHYHNISLVGGPGVYRYGNGIKLHTLHDFFLLCPTHVLFRYNRAPCTQPHCVSCTLTHRRPPQWWRYGGLTARSLRHVDALIAPSPFIRDVHQQRGVTARMVDLPNFVPATDARGDSEESPPDEAPPDGAPGEGERPYFLFVGRLESIKGLQRVIPRLREYGGARLLVAGAGSYRPELEKLAGGSSNIRFLGQVSQARLRGLYRHARAVLVPSICYEVFPTVILEAFEQKTPVIVNNLGGMPGLVDESGGGLVYETDAGMRAALERLTADAGYARELGLRGHRSFEERWTVDVHMGRYFALIDELAASRSQTR
jgi:glycosyltransferase involved in cell wall biosynthesis